MPVHFMKRMEKFWSEKKEKEGIVWDREPEGKGKDEDVEERWSHTVLIWLCSSTDKHQAPDLGPELSHLRPQSSYWFLSTHVVTQLRALTLFKGAPQRWSALVCFNSVCFECVSGLYPAYLAVFCLTAHHWYVYLDLSFDISYWADLLHLTLLYSLLS